MYQSVATARARIDAFFSRAPAMMLPNQTMVFDMEQHISAKPFISTDTTLHVILNSTAATSATGEITV
jgi:hypothetical protein